MMSRGIRFGIGVVFVVGVGGVGFIDLSRVI